MAQQTLNTPRETTHQRIADALEDIVDKIVDTSSADNVDYDNTQSGLNANKVQGAIDELAEEKVDKVTGKGLSTNDYTDAEKQKLANIESNAQANVQSDWNEDDTEDDAYINNKPDLSTSLTATGNPLTIESAEANLVECTAKVEAVQDLHGYDHPWVGGAGKNKLPMTVDGIKGLNTSGTWSGNNYTLSGITFTIQTDSDNNVIGIKINGTISDDSAIFNLANYTASSGDKLNGCNDTTSNTYYIYARGGSSVCRNSDVTISNNDVGVARLYAIAVVNNTTISNAIVYPMIRLATETDATFEPYSNISPITGQTEVVIDDVGKNLWDEQWELGSIDGTTGEPVSNSNIIRSKNFNRCDSGKTYYCKASSGANIHIYYYDAFKNYISKQDGFANNAVTTPSNTAYFKIIIFGTTYDNNVSVNYPSTDHDYHAYTGKTYRVEIGQKNKLPMTVDGIKSANTSGTWNGNTLTKNNGTFEILTDGDNNVTGIRMNGTFNAITAFNLPNPTLASGSYALNGCPSGLSGNVAITIQNIGNDEGSGAIFTLSTQTTPNIWIGVKSGYTANNLIFKPMIRTTIDDSEFVPYNPNLPEAIYGGELDVVKGELVVDRGIITEETAGSFVSASTSGGGLHWIDYSNAQLLLNKNVISNMLPYYSNNNEAWNSTIPCISYYGDERVRIYTDATSKTDFQTRYAGLQVVYPLATPYTIQLTPQQIRLLESTNRLSCNTGDLSIKYYPDNVLGQLKGDIESEYDERVETLEEKAENALKIKSITTTTVTNQQGVSTQSYDNYVQGDKKFIPVSIIAKTTGYDAVDVHYVLDESNRVIYFIPKDLTGSAIPSGRTVSMTIHYFEI